VRETRSSPAPRSMPCRRSRATCLATLARPERDVGSAREAGQRGKARHGRRRREGASPKQTSRPPLFRGRPRAILCWAIRAGARRLSARGPRVCRPPRRMARR
jgi:hypothetical protein